VGVGVNGISSQQSSKLTLKICSQQPVHVTLTNTSNKVGSIESIFIVLPTKDENTASFEIVFSVIPV
jgi:hypothetical protein